MTKTMYIVGKDGFWVKSYPNGLIFNQVCTTEAQRFDLSTANEIAAISGGKVCSELLPCECDKCKPASQPNNVVIINGEDNYLSVLSEVGCKFRECVLSAELFSEERAKYVVFLFPRLKAIPASTPCRCIKCYNVRQKESSKINEALESGCKIKTSWLNDDALADRKGLEIAKEWGGQG